MLPSIGDMAKRVEDGVNYAKNHWDEGLAYATDEVSKAVSKPVGDISSAIVTWGRNNPGTLHIIREVAKPIIRPICNYSPMVLHGQEATQTGQADDLLGAFDFKRDWAFEAETQYYFCG
jgi:hypothetical protein